MPKTQIKEMCVVGIRVPIGFREELRIEAGDSTITSVIMKKINDFDKLAEDNKILKKGINQFNLLMSVIKPIIPDFIKKDDIRNAVQVI